MVKATWFIDARMASLTVGYLSLSALPMLEVPCILDDQPDYVQSMTFSRAPLQSLCHLFVVKSWRGHHHHRRRQDHVCDEPRFFILFIPT